jgi:hypothetical protein
MSLCVIPTHFEQITIGQKVEARELLALCLQILIQCFLDAVQLI